MENIPPFIEGCDAQRSYWLTRINVPSVSRGKGHASQLLSTICQDADLGGYTLYLAVSPSDGLNAEQLIAWYNRHGFRSKDKTGRLMERKPQWSPVYQMNHEEALP